MSKTVRIMSDIPELADLSRKLRDEMRDVFGRNVEVAIVLGGDDVPKRISIGIAMSAAAVGTTLQMLVVSMAAGLNREVTTAEAALFMILNDGTTPLDKVTDRARALIDLATRNGFDMKLDSGFDPVAETKEMLKQKLRTDPAAARELRKFVDKDPELARQLQRLGIDIDEYVR